MKNTLFFILLFLTGLQGVRAQTKIFKEINSEISSDMKAIVQDGSLVGYLVFTQFEKASADSFNYKITIMDENLNDIGAINFREEKLSLKAVVFEQDVLCLGYLKSNIIGNEFKNRRAFRNALPAARNYVFTQFLNLNCTILSSGSIPVDIKVTEQLNYSANLAASGQLKQDIQLKNIPQKGFACFYGDDNKNTLVVFNTSGKLSWQRPVREQAQEFLLQSSGQDVYILLKEKEKMAEGGFELLGYNAKDSTTYPKLVLKDKNGSSLKVLAFDNDPSTGKPFLSGYVINPRRGDVVYTGRDIGRGAYSGVFTINLDSHKKGGIEEVYSYWNDGSQPSMSKKGYYRDYSYYALYVRSFRDFQGNTYFAGNGFTKKFRWGGVVTAIITLPLIITPILALESGTDKCRIKDALLLRQNAKGTLSLDNSIKADYTKSYPSATPFELYDQRTFYCVSNPDTRTDYVIIDDAKNIIIYNVNQKKTARTIPHKDGNLRISVFPAKEGHMMISEYNKKERSTRFSIESL